MTRLPTTALSQTSPYFSSDPHAESHELSGDDPLLGQIRVLSVTEVTTTFTTSSGTFVDVTGLSSTVSTNGGRLLIMVAGVSAADDSSAGTSIGPGMRFRVTITPVTGSVVNLKEYLSRFDGGGHDATGTGVLWASGTLTWTYLPTIAGEYTVQVQIRTDSGAVNVSLPSTEGDVDLIIFELLPIRRA